MLVLSRRSGQTIEIDGGISVQVLSVKGSQVKIGIVAPKAVRVLRGELDDSFRRDTQAIPQLSRVDHCPAVQELYLQAGPAC